MESVLERVKRIPKSVEPKKLLKRKWILLLLILAAAAIAALALRGGGRRSVQTSYQEAPVASRTITSALTGSGTLLPANSYTVTTLVEGDILTAGFEEGDMVEKDTVLYEIDSSDAANNIEKAQISLNQARRNYEDAVDGQYLRAGSSGSLFSLLVDVGDEVAQGQEIAVIRQSGTMKLTVSFPADDAEGFYVGQAAEVLLDGSFETLEGTVTAVSGSDIVGTGNMVTRNVTVSVKNPGGLGVEQAASVTINGVGCAAAGTFAYQSESTLVSSVSGTVAAVHVKEGQTVSKDQILLTLSGDSLEEKVQSAQDSLRSAELSMDSTQNQLDSYTITSPIQGTIVDKQYKAGDTVEGGKTLCTIYDLSYLELTMNIDELDISKISEGQSVQVTADAVEGQTYTGVITKVSVLGSTSSGVTSYPVTVRIDETDGLRPGMNVDAKIILEEAENVLSVPVEAVNRGGLVLVTQDSPSASSAAEQEAPEGYVYVTVETGVSDDDYIEVTSGLQEGDTVAYVPSSGDNSMAFPGGMGGGPMGGSGGGPGGGASSGGPGGAPGGMGGGPMG